MKSGKLPIVQYWHSTQLPPEISRLATTFRELNPGLGHRIFSETDAEELIKLNFSARELAAFRACAVPAMQADYFRYCAVLTLGGVYADADFRCLCSLEPLLQATPGGLLARGPRNQVLNSFFVFSVPGHPLLQLTLDLATANIEGRIGERIWHVTGPGIFTGLALLHHLGSPEAARREVPNRGIGQLVHLLLETVDDYTRISEAFEGVRIVSYETVTEWIGKPEISLPHKRSEMDWRQWQKRGESIFR
jgi:Glycosyltransferase sugar-binding region containing DXD motif